METATKPAKKTPKNRPVIDWTRSNLPALSYLHQLMAVASPVNFAVYNPGYYFAFASMETAKDSFGADDGVSICLYALGNWSSARTAKGCRELRVFGVGSSDPVPCDPCYFVRECLKRHVELARGK